MDSAINPLTPELNLRTTLPGEIFYWGFCFLNRATWAKNQQTHQLFIQFINYVW
jgi:hypothetical protein